MGSGREKAIRNKLKNILPQGVGVGSGFVVDSYGNTSNQCDIIIYDENYALKFVVNDDENNAYYNCECVIAVGEIKSDADINDVQDAFYKFKRIRALVRRTNNTLVHRSYLSNLLIEGTEFESFEPKKKETDQIYTFLLCKSLKTPINTITDRAKKILQYNHQYFNYILSIEGNAITYFNRDEGLIKLSAMSASDFVEVNNEPYNFNLFISRLDQFIRLGRTVPINNSSYLLESTNLKLINAISIV